MAVTVNEHFRVDHKGKVYLAGKTISDLSKAEEERLLKKGAVRNADKTAVSSPTEEET